MDHDSNQVTRPPVHPTQSQDTPVKESLVSLPLHVLEDIIWLLPARGDGTISNDASLQGRKHYSRVSRTCKTLYAIVTSKRFKIHAFKTEFRAWSDLIDELWGEEFRALQNLTNVFCWTDGFETENRFGIFGSICGFGSESWLSWILGTNDGVLLELTRSMGCGEGVWRATGGGTQARCVTLLLFAALHGLEEVVEVCLDAVNRFVNDNADMVAQNDRHRERKYMEEIGDMALECAAIAKSEKVVKVLRSRGFSLPRPASIVPPDQELGWPDVKHDEPWGRWADSIRFFLLHRKQDYMIPSINCLIDAVEEELETEDYRHIEYLIPSALAVDPVLHLLLDRGHVQDRLIHRGILPKEAPQQITSSSEPNSEDKEPDYEHEAHVAFLHLTNPPSGTTYRFLNDIVPGALNAPQIDYLNSPDIANRFEKEVAGLAGWARRELFEVLEKITKRGGYDEAEAWIKEKMAVDWEEVKGRLAAESELAAEPESGNTSS
ncbi:hypothetical protein HK104_008888 [Borealophlyctis nickersoniae]|nr:hypothetical protein HK104_008888 [Borealophlyctis nickersoniae]